MIAGQDILVTGGAGYVGRKLIRYLLEMEPGVVRVFDQNESGLANLKRSINDDRCRFLAGDIRDKDRLQRAIKDIDVVIHMAAMKHVDLSEYNPFEAVKTNVVGLQNVVDVSIDASVNRLIFTSSDKAVNPANTMGTTKLLGEKLVTAGNKYSGPSEIKLACVRFGNVFHSSESVVPLFRRQIRHGGPITLTDPRMTRFFLDVRGLLNLVTDAIDLAKGGEIFISKMPAIRIEDLAISMIQTFAPEHGHTPDNIDIEVTGPRIGETFHEHMMTAREAKRAIENEEFYAVLPETIGDGYLEHDGLPGFDPAENIIRSSEQASTLDLDEIVELLETSEFMIE